MRTNRHHALKKVLSLLLPAIPYHDAEMIHNAAKAPHMQSLPASIAIWLASVAYIRHTYTDYDILRDDGYDRDSARYFVRDAINEKLSQWHATRFIEENEDV